ncbi:MAG TPA: GNAT family N-acetyltransferase [Sunxiuqinia sp.]|nr:GNAT family N-acetyltransferase [Sunxiuqinia sp.]
MNQASYSDKSWIVELLTQAFLDNKSVNYVVKQDAKRHRRIANLMAYSFEICWNWGKVYISDDKKAAVLVLIPQHKKTNFKAIKLDVQLVLNAVGIRKVTKVLSRESKIKKHHPEQPFFYLWFIGVAPEHQQQGIGSALLNEIIRESGRQNYPIYLETSTAENLPFYKKFNFSIYHTMKFGFPLYFMRLES